MDYEIAKFWFDIVQTLLIFAVGFQNYMSRRHAITVANIEKLEDDIGGKMNKHADRLARVERDLAHAPTHEDIGKVHEKINEVAISNGKILGILGEMSKSFDRFTTRGHQ